MLWRRATAARGHGPRSHGFEPRSLPSCVGTAGSARSGAFWGARFRTSAASVPSHAKLFFSLVPCCLTGRSKGLPPARHLARKALAVIIRLAGQAPSRRQPLSFNVRQQRESLAVCHRRARPWAAKSRLRVPLAAQSLRNRWLRSFWLLAGRSVRYLGCHRALCARLLFPHVPRCLTGRSSGTCAGMALGPRGALPYRPPRGPSATPAAAP